jgi:sulfite exporter TauE/SafE
MADPSTAGNPVGLAVFAVVGLLGGAHCLGMCGPLVTTYADRMPGYDRGVTFAQVRQHLLFNLGRTASYAALGALAGLVGALAFEAAAVASIADGVRAVTGVAVGAFIVVTGVSYVVRGSTAIGHDVPVASAAFGRVYGAVTARVDDWVGGPRIAALGALHGLLPCPLIYPAYLYALARGSPVEGALSLAALGLGTVPTLFAYGVAFGSLGQRTRMRLHRALGVAFVALGYLALSHGLLAVGIHVPHPSIPGGWSEVSP